MSYQPAPEDFIRESQSLLRDYVQTRFEILRLQGIRAFAQAAGTLIWAILLLFLVFLLLIFGGLVLGFWFSSMLESYVAGFALATGVLLLAAAGITVMRNTLFINPILRRLVQQMHQEGAEENEKEE